MNLRPLQLYRKRFSAFTPGAVASSLLFAGAALTGCETGDVEGPGGGDAALSYQPLTPVVTATNDPNVFDEPERDESGATKPPNPNTVVSANPTGCDGDGETFSTVRSRCYRVVSEPQLTWSQAAADCSLWSAGRGHLAVVTSREEDDFLSTLIKTPVWLGATDAKSEDAWTWLSSEVWFYQNFGAGLPDNAESVEHCLSKQAAPGQWDDVSCGTKLGYVCERAAQQ